MGPATVRIAIARTVSQRFPRLWLERELRYRPNHFEPEFWLIPILCDSDKTSIDVGANMGTYSYYMGKHSKKVVLFEPNLDLWPHLRRLLGSNLDLIGAALSAQCSTSTFRVDPQNTGVATIEQKNELSCVAEKSKVVSRTVETKTLDSFNFSDVSLIKIDVEGHEEAVIEGAQDTIRRNQPAFIIESENRHNPGAPRRLAEKMLGLGYRGFFLKNSRLVDIEKLSDEDMRTENLTSADRPYINNFIFLPNELEAKLDRLRAYFANSKS